MQACTLYFGYALTTTEDRLNRVGSNCAVFRLCVSRSNQQIRFPEDCDELNCPAQPSHSELISPVCSALVFASF